MKIKELYELIEEKQDLLKVKEVSKNAILEKSENLEDEKELEQLKEEAEQVSSEVEELEKEISELKEKALNKEDELNKQVEQIEKNKNIGGNEMNYLQTKQSAIDFIEVLSKSTNRGEFTANWQTNLKEKAITGADAFLPCAVTEAVENFFADYSGVLNYVTKDPRFAVKITGQTVKNIATGRADENATKVESDFAFDDFNINVDEIYAAVRIGYKSLKLDAVNGAKMVDYIIGELANAIVRGVEKQIILGTDTTLAELHGIASENNASLIDSATADFTSAKYTDVEIGQILAGVEKLEGAGQPVLVTSKEIARKMKSAYVANVGFIDPNPFGVIKNGANDILGMTVIVYDFMATATNPLIAFNAMSYRLIGTDPTSPDMLSEYDIFYNNNKQGYEAIGLVGGRLTEYKSAVLFTQA